MQELVNQTDTIYSYDNEDRVTYDFSIPTSPTINDFDFFKSLDQNVEFSLNMFQVIVFTMVLFFVTFCIPNNRFSYKISKLEEKIENLENQIEDFDKEKQDAEKNKQEHLETVSELESKIKQFENENAFLVSRLKKLEEKNVILVNSLEEFITKKYATHPYNLRKKEKVDYTPQLNSSENESEDEQDNEG